MAFRFSLTSLFSALLILGAAHACYYQYYQEPPADFKCRWEQVGCGLEVKPEQAVFQACCAPLAPGAFAPATCSDIASSAMAKGTTCSSGPVNTQDMPSSFAQPPPRPSLPAAACITTWVTETAAPNCPSAVPPPAPPAPAAVTSSTPVASKINAVPTISTPDVPIPSSSPPPAAPPVVTTSAPAQPPPPQQSDCICPGPRAGSLPPRLGKRTDGGDCHCPEEPPAPSDTCACHGAAALPPPGFNPAYKKRDGGAKSTCPCPAVAAQTSTSTACPCSTDRAGSLPPGGLGKRDGGECSCDRSGAAPPPGFDGGSAPPPRKRALPEPGFVPDSLTLEQQGGGTASKINAVQTLSSPEVPHNAQPTSMPPPAPACTTTMTTTMTPDCPPASLINGVPTSSASAPPPGESGTDEEDCEDETTSSAHPAGALP